MAHIFCSRGIADLSIPSADGTTAIYGIKPYLSDFAVRGLLFSMTVRKAVLLGVPVDLGAERLGVDMGPNALRYRNIAKKLRLSKIYLDDQGDITIEDLHKAKVGSNRARYLDAIARVDTIVAKRVAGFLKNECRVICIGGDHSIAIGTVSGASSIFSEDLGLIWIDAHGDLNSHKTTITGNIHGMALAALIGIGHKKLVQLYNRTTKIKTENLLLIGTKDLDPPEKFLIKKRNLNVFSPTDILSDGLSPLFQRIEKLQASAKNIWVSLDVDVVDKEFAPGVGMPNSGGLTYREISSICSFIGNVCNVIGCDIVEYNPVNDINHKTSDMIIELTARLCGGQYSSYMEYLAANAVR